MPSDSLPEVSPKSTKDQILLAYNAVLAKLQDKQLSKPEEEKRKQDQAKVIERAANKTSSDIISELSHLKIELSKHIDLISHQMSEQFSKLQELKEAVTLEQEHLSELYGIKETAQIMWLQ